jgi:hypothetical protein
VQSWQAAASAGGSSLVSALPAEAYTHLLWFVTRCDQWAGAAVVHHSTSGARAAYSCGHGFSSPAASVCALCVSVP